MVPWSGASTIAYVSGSASSSKHGGERNSGTPDCAVIVALDGQLGGVFTVLTFTSIVPVSLPPWPSSTVTVNSSGPV